MTLNVEAIFQNGQLQFKTPVQLADGTPVRVTITPLDEEDDPLAAVIGICDDGPPVSLAERHDEFIYGLKGQAEGRP